VTAPLMSDHALPSAERCHWKVALGSLEAAVRVWPSWAAPEIDAVMGVPISRTLVVIGRQLALAFPCPPFAWLYIRDWRSCLDHVTAPCLPRLSPPRLDRQRILRHHHAVGEPAAALGASESQVLQRHVAAAGIDDRLKISQRLVMTGFAPHVQAQIGLRQHAARSRQIVRHRRSQASAVTNNSPWASRAALSASCQVSCGATPIRCSGRRGWISR